MQDTTNTPLPRATRHALPTDWPAAEAVDSVTLDFDARHRRRIVMQTDTGSEILLDLDRAVAMADGDGIALEDGRWIAIKAAPEPLIEIKAASPGLLLRLTWHIGNRHLPAEISADALYIRPDKVIEAMLADLGATLAACHRSFQPERGAYGQSKEDTPHDASHDPGHDHGHSHDH